jgi:hypothetical protein
MDYGLDQQVLMLIQQRYTGGQEAFRKEGGQIYPLGGQPHTVLIYHPEPRAELMEMLEEINNYQDGKVINLQIVTTKNFQDLTVAQFSETGKNLSKRIEDLKLGVNFILSMGEVCTFVALDTDKSKYVDPVEKVLKETRGLLRGAVLLVGANKLHIMEQSPARAYPKPASKKLSKTSVSPEVTPVDEKAVTEHTERTKAIGDDDVLNLRIMLNQDMSFDEFLKKM